MAGPPTTPDYSSPGTDRQPSHTPSAAPPPSASSASAAAARSSRVLSCVLCQQRKIKCDKKFPCTNCIRSNARCVQATLAPRRKRRVFPERLLLDRLRKYESMLQKHKIDFEPLTQDPDDLDRAADSAALARMDDSDDNPGHESPALPHSRYQKREFSSKYKDIWKAMRAGVREVDEPLTPETPEDELTLSARDYTFSSIFDDDKDVDGLIFGGAHAMNTNLPHLHPDPVHIFRLWQVYVENVNPLLKVTHIPTLQARIVAAAADVTSIEPHLQALMFAIYCVAVISLTTEDCEKFFDSSRRDLLTRYSHGCQQSLLKCSFLRSTNLDCLTALHLYLMSVEEHTDPRTMSTMLGMPIRIARRLAIDTDEPASEASDRSFLETEMRRRLWWSITMFDNRFCELSDIRQSSLTPLWDCKVPHCINDVDFSADTKEAPTVQGKTPDALFAVVRSEVTDVLRHAEYHLDFVNPTLKNIAKDTLGVSKASDLKALGHRMEEKYLQFCSPDNPIHYMTIWFTRYMIAKAQLLDFFAESCGHSAAEVDAQRDVGLSFAFRWIESDARIHQSPLTKGYRWFMNYHFPMPAYMHVIQELKRRPTSSHADKCWDIIGEHYDARMGWFPNAASKLLFETFSKLVFQAWRSREAALGQGGQLVPMPRVIMLVKEKLAELKMTTPSPELTQLTTVPGVDFGFDDFSIPNSVQFGDNNMVYGPAGLQMSSYMAPPADPPGMGMSHQWAAGMNQMQWNMMNWNLANNQGL